jgi:hypothetical protein
MKIKLTLAFVLVLVNLSFICTAQKVVNVSMQDPCNYNSLPEQPGQGLLDFMIIPNPNDGHFVLDLQNRVNGKIKVSVQIINPVGNIVFSQESIMQNGSYDVKELKLLPGIYYLRLQSDKRSSVKMFVVQ